MQLVNARASRFAVAIVMASVVAHAQPAPPEPEVPPSQVSGLVEQRDPEDGAGRKVARATLWPVRGVWFVAWAPVRGLLWAYDRFAIENRLRKIFFTEDGRLGVFPMAHYESGYGGSIGVRVVLRDVLGTTSRLQADFHNGGPVAQSYVATYRTGTLLGDDVRMRVRGGYEIMPRNRFFGIGNLDLESGPAPMGSSPDRAFDTRFHFDSWFAEGEATMDLAPPFALRVGGGYRRRSFDLPEDEDDELDSFDVYDRLQLVGADVTLSSPFVEAELALDTLEQPRFDVSRATPSTGWYVAVRAGVVHGVGSDPSRFARWRVDVRRYVNLYRHDRILVLRGLARAVSADSIDDVPFIDLPTLGGNTLLRGYAQDRFRDRRAALVSAEYEWGVDRNLAAFVFVDAGRVWSDRDELADRDFLPDVRVGFGGGLQLQSMTSHLARIFAASSRDGGFFLFASFDPLFDTRRTTR